MASSSTFGAYGGMSGIPAGLDDKQRSVYDTLIKLRNQRKQRTEAPPNIAVITDLAKDFDDLTAMVVLKELHRLGLIKLCGFIANLKPERKRAIYGRGALDSLGLIHIPIAIGTDGIGTQPPGNKLPQDTLTEYAYEFKAPFYTRTVSNPPTFRKGADLLDDICLKAQKEGKKVTFLLISSLKDIHEFTSDKPQNARRQGLFQAVVKNVVLQGDYDINPQLTPKAAAANNIFAWDAAQGFHKLMDTTPIQSAVYTKSVAYTTHLTPKDFADLAATGHEIGKHLYKVHTSQEREYYHGAWYAPTIFTRERFLEKKTNWYESHNDTDPYPNPDTGEILQYLTKVVVYDALAALAAAGQDVLAALRIKDENRDLHEIVGHVGPEPVKEDIPDVNVENMRGAIKALLKGSFLASKQGLPSSPS